VSDRPLIFVAAGDTARNPARSGIQTTVRRLVAELARRFAARTRLAYWNRHTGFLQSLPPQFSLGLAAETLRRDFRLSLSQRIAAFPGWFPGRADHRIPLHRHPGYARDLRDAWLLLPELLYGVRRAERLISYARRHGMKIAAIFHDAIPVEHPEYCPPGLPELHRAYMRELSKVDLVLPVSEVTASAWQNLIRREGLPPPKVQVIPLAAEIAGVPRVLHPPTPRTGTIRGLCVSTIEPRKNHQTLCGALDLIARTGESLPFEMDFVGAADRSAPELQSLVAAAVKRSAGRLRWHRYADSNVLRRFYEQSDFTVYPSVVEGFGLPVLESLWFARPCICANFGVMQENARAGGCLTVDVRDATALAAAMQRLITEPDLRLRLANEATLRPIRTWSDYADGVLQALDRH
jgi:glycosyltransferase involved in cell wall biosynthesis